MEPIFLHIRYTSSWMRHENIMTVFPKDRQLATFRCASCGVVSEKKRMCASPVVNVSAAIKTWNGCHQFQVRFQVRIVRTNPNIFYHCLMHLPGVCLEVLNPSSGTKKNTPNREICRWNRSNFAKSFTTSSLHRFPTWMLPLLSR